MSRARTPTAHLARLLERIGRRWDELCLAYAGLSDEEMTAPGVVGRWSVRDIVAHVSAWRRSR